MDSQIIQAGQFNNKSSETDRTQMLKQVLRAPRDADDDLNDAGDVPDDEDINRLLCRSEEEFVLFQKMDADDLVERSKAAAAAVDAGKSPASTTRLMREEHELPEWVMAPDAVRKSVSELDDQFMQSHGRGRRKRKPVVYSDGVTEREWTSAIERGGDPSEVSARKQRRAKARRTQHEASPSLSASRSGSESTRDVHASLRIQADMSSSSDDVPMDDERDLDFQERRRSRGGREKVAGQSRQALPAAASASVAAVTAGPDSGRAKDDKANRDATNSVRSPPGMDDSTQAAIAAAIRIRDYGLDDSGQEEGQVEEDDEGSGATSEPEGAAVRVGAKRRRGRPRAEDGAHRSRRQQKTRSGSRGDGRRAGAVVPGRSAAGTARGGVKLDGVANIREGDKPEKEGLASAQCVRRPGGGNVSDDVGRRALGVAQPSRVATDGKAASRPDAPLPSEGEIDSHATRSADDAPASRPGAMTGQASPSRAERKVHDVGKTCATPGILARVTATGAHLSEGEVSEVESGEIAEGSSRCRGRDPIRPSTDRAPSAVLPLNVVTGPTRGGGGGGDEDESFAVRRPRRRGDSSAVAVASMSDGEVAPGWVDAGDLSGADALGPHGVSAAGASSSEASEGEGAGQGRGSLAAGPSSGAVGFGASAGHRMPPSAGSLAGPASMPPAGRGRGVHDTDGDTVGSRILVCNGPVKALGRPMAAASDRTGSAAARGASPLQVAQFRPTGAGSLAPSGPHELACGSATAAAGHDPSDAPSTGHLPSPFVASSDAAAAAAAMAAACRVVAECPVVWADHSGVGEGNDGRPHDGVDGATLPAGRGDCGKPQVAAAVTTGDAPDTDNEDGSTPPSAPSSPRPPPSAAGMTPIREGGSDSPRAPPRRTSRRSSGASSAAAASPGTTPSPGAAAGRGTRHKAGANSAAASSSGAGLSTGAGSVERGAAVGEEAGTSSGGRRGRRRARKKSIWL